MTQQPAAMHGQVIAPGGGGARAVSTTVRVPIAVRAGLLPWVPFWMSLGIGGWFALPFDPGPLHYGLAALLVVGCLTVRFASVGLAARGRITWDRADAARLGAVAFLLIALGFLSVGMRAAIVEAPVLKFRYYGGVEGRVVQIDRSSGDRLRLTLDRVVLENTPPSRMPERVRISLFVTDPMPVPGQRVMLTAHLGPPNGPSEPGGFDFRRMAWFDGLGAVGYSRTPVMTVAPPESGGALALHRLRMRLSEGIVSAIGGQAGAVSSALMTGDRSAITEATNDVMRASSLYHIISISGLHMTMLAGFVYAALRLAGVVLQLAGAMPRAMHKWAAGGALLASLVYLWLSGGGVATERSFIMVAVMLFAIIADRRAISLRTVAVAATLILAWTPEALGSAGFQMSFAATVALILSQGPWSQISPHLPWWLKPAGMLVLSSLIAGLATTPIAAAHFGRISQYGMLANLLVVPVVGAVVMPAGVIAAVLALLGLAQPALWCMGLGTKWMLFVAEWVAGLGGAVTVLPAPPGIVLPLIGIGGCLMVLAPVAVAMGAQMRHSPHRLIGVACLVAGAAIWACDRRPLMLVSHEGDAVGIMTPDGRALSRPRGGSFTAANWLEADGDRADQQQAAARPLWTGDNAVRTALLRLPTAEVAIHHLMGKRGAERAGMLCQQGAILIANLPLSDLLGPKPPCRVFDSQRLRRTGALALFADDELSYRVVTVRDRAGERAWSGGGR
ncbi:ComEC/Rec2 family competence protein [Paracoccus laeviglucosivorans]|uniref:ComEC/Rec2 family competence protein n=1 Tax=Paracoccus laeviglucosivorans TaxID=1197861 RepID=UPI001FE413DE|nr:ComEC/Rec2 family competence protein [Paracoccus laeviglucosivorans]